MSLDEVLRDLERDLFVEHGKRHEILKSLAQELTSERDDSDAHEASLLAGVFALVANPFTSKSSEEYRRFGPMFSDGSRAYPVLDNLPSEDWDILRRHAAQTENPAIKARYTDVLWEYTRDHQQAKAATCAYIEYASLSLNALKSGNAEREALWELADALPRAVRISLEIRAPDLTQCAMEATTQAIGELIRIEETDPIHLLVDPLIEGKKAIKLVDLSALRASIEEAVEVTRRTQSEPVFTGEQLLRRVQRIGEVTNDKDVRRNALIGLAELYVEQGDSECQRSHMVATGWYGKAAGVLKEAGDVEEALRRVLIKHEQANAASVDEMKQFGGAVSIPREEFEAMLNQIRETTDKQGIGVLSCADVLPSPEEQREAVKKNAKNHPLSALLPRVVTDGTRVTKSTHGIDDNIQHMVTQQVLWGLQCQTLTIAKCATDHLREKGVSVEEALRTFLVEARWVSKDRVEIISGAIERYIEGDFVSAVHVLTPQIEGLIRDLVHCLGSHTTTTLRDGTTQYRPLGDLLRDPKLLELLGSDLAENLRIILTEQIGLNIRNDVAHGVPPQWEYSEPTVLLLIVVVCQLARVRAHQ